MLPSTTLSYKPCTKHFPAPLCTTQSLRPVLLCTTKLAQTTSQHYFVLQSLHKALPSIYYFVLQSLHRARPSTTLYYKACAKHFAALLCTTQSLHKALPSTTLYYTKHVPVLLCSTKLAQTTSQYYFVLQSLHKPLPSTTLYYTKLAPSTTWYYKACKKYSPVLLCTTELAQSTSQYYFALQTLHRVRPSITLWYKACTKKAFIHSKFFRREAFTHSRLFKQRSFYTQKLLHTTSFYTEKLLDPASCHTQQAFTHRTLTHSALHMASVYTHRNFYTEKLLHTASFYTQNLLHTASFYRKRLKKVFTQRSFLVHNHTRNCSSKAGISAPKPKKTRFGRNFSKDT